MSMSVHFSDNRSAQVARISVDRSDCCLQSTNPALLYVECPLLKPGMAQEKAPQESARALIDSQQIVRIDLGEGQVLVQYVHLTQQGEDWQLVCRPPVH